MRKLAIILLCVVAAFSYEGAAAAKPTLPDSISAREAFVKMPAQSLDLLDQAMRREMLHYLDADTICDVMNAMEGMSHLIAPVTDRYLRVQVTPVTTLCLHTLPYKKGMVVASIYTVGDSLQAKDSDLRFYDTEMHPLPREKFIKIAESKDFLDLKDVDSSTRRELLSLIPFPTVEYSLSPGSDILTATLTVGEFMGKENMDKLLPYLQRTRSYRWNGTRYELISIK